MSRVTRLILSIDIRELRPYVAVPCVLLLTGCALWCVQLNLCGDLWRTGACGMWHVACGMCLYQKRASPSDTRCELVAQSHSPTVPHSASGYTRKDSDRVGGTAGRSQKGVRQSGTALRETAPIMALPAFQVEAGSVKPPEIRG